MGNRIFILFLIIISFLFGVVFSPFRNYYSTSLFYAELRKRALTSSDFICNEAKEAKFLYDKYKIKD